VSRLNKFGEQFAAAMAMAEGFGVKDRYEKWPPYGSSSKKEGTGNLSPSLFRS
jgi:hypothetical protein